MPNTNKLFSLSITFSLGVMLTLIAGLTSSASAQFKNDNSGYQSNEQDATYGDGIGGLSPTELIHRAQQIGNRSAEEFQEDSQGQIRDSASEFKQLQQQRMLEQYQSETTPAESTSE